jgi:hypothetical protein
MNAITSPRIPTGIFNKNIDPRYLSEQKTGFKHFGQRYNIGHYKKFIMRDV